MKKLLLIPLILLMSGCENKEPYIGSYVNTEDDLQTTIVLKENFECEYITIPAINGKVDKDAITETNKNCFYKLNSKTVLLTYTIDGNEAQAFYKFSSDYNSFNDVENSKSKFKKTS